MILSLFTYELDAECLSISLERARTLFPDSPIYIWDDEHRPMAQDWGFRTVRTSFHRNGNLKGREAFEGMISCHKYALDEHPEETHVLRLDPDSLIVRPDRILQAIKDNVYAAAWAFKGAPFTGMAQLLSREFVDEAHSFLASGRLVPGSTCSMGEGRQTGTLARLLAEDREVRTWDYHPLHGFAAAYQYEKAKVPLAEYVRRYDVINFGNGKSCVSGRIEAALTMSKVSKWLEL